MKRIIIYSILFFCIASFAVCLAKEKNVGDEDLKEVMPQAAKFESVISADKVVYYKALDQDGKLIGIAFLASGQGYAGSIETLAGMTLDGKITAIKVVSQKETPWLGGKVAKNEFTKRFRDKDLNELNEVQAISGATISSRAVIDSVKKKAQELKEGISRELN